MDNKKGLKGFYGSVSLSARVDFALNSEDAEKAVFEDIEGLELILKDGSRLEITDVHWDLITSARQGNVMQPNVDDFSLHCNPGNKGVLCCFLYSFDC